jgi:hypothetical protein
MTLDRQAIGREGSGGARVGLPCHHYFSSLLCLRQHIREASLAHCSCALVIK